MSKEGRHDEEDFLWENGTWAVLSNNSDDSRDTGEKSSGNRRKKKKVTGSSSNSQTERGQEPATRGKTKRGKGEMIDGGGDTIKEGDKGGESDHEIHIWTERERRKKMRNMFANLHALLPQLPPKADKSTIVDEAVNYIKTLQQTVQKLQKQKLERLQGAASFGCYEPSLIVPQKLPETREAFLADQGSSNSLAITTTTVNNNNNCASVPSVPSYPVLFQTWTSSNVVLNICGHEAQISVCSPKKPGLFSTICYVLEKNNIEVLSAHVCSDCSRSMYMIQAHHVSGASDAFADAFPVEEIYRQAAAEIMCWVSS